MKRSARFEGCGRVLLLLFAGEKERVSSMFKQQTELLQKVLNLLAMPAWMQSEQLHDYQLDIFAGLIDAFSQLSDYAGSILIILTSPALSSAASYKVAKLFFILVSALRLGSGHSLFSSHRVVTMFSFYYVTIGDCTEQVVLVLPALIISHYFRRTYIYRYMYLRHFLEGSGCSHIPYR